MKPKIVFFLMLATLVITLVASTFSYLHFSSILSNSRDKLADKELELKNSYDYLDYLEGLELETEELEAELGDLTGIYPQNKLQSQFIAQIRQLAIRNGIIIQDNTISFPATSGLPTAASQLEKSTSVASLIGMPVQFTAVGAYSDQMNFLKDLENFRRLINVSSIDLQPGNSSNQTINNIILDVLVQQNIATTDDDSSGSNDEPESGATP